VTRSSTSYLEGNNYNIFKLLVQFVIVLTSCNGCVVVFIISIFIIYSSLAGTTGAVVTCPLEVVKTRLQSSSSFGATRYDYVPRIASEDSGGSRMTCKTISSLQRRRYNTLSGAGGRHSSTQILTFSQCGVGNQTTKSMGLLQCLR